MRSKQVQILSGICGVQLIGYACRAAGFKTDIWIETHCLMLPLRAFY